MLQNQKSEKHNYRYFVFIFFIIFVLILGIEVFGYFKNSNKQNEIKNNANEVIQIDILNGCGVSGVGQKFTDHLRSNEFDVVANGNYKNFYVDETFIIDRIGNDYAAKQLAQILQIAPEKIIKEINPSYFVAFSVVIGKNYKLNLTKKE